MTRIIKNNHTLGIAYAVIGGMLFSAKALFAKFGFHHEIDVLPLLILRGMVAIPIFAVILGIHAKKYRPTPLSIRQILTIMLLGFLGYYISSILNFYGLTFIPASLERTLFYLYPSITLLLGAIIYKTTIQKKQVASLVLTYMGLIITIGSAQALTHTTHTYIGIGLVFMSTISYALYILLSHSTIQQLGAVRFTGLVIISSYSFMLIHYLFMYGFTVPPLTPDSLTLALLLGIFSTVIPTLMISSAIYLIGSANTALAGIAGPVSTIFLAQVFLSESLTTAQYGGIVLVLLGVIILNRVSKS